MDKQTYSYTNHDGETKETSQKYENYFYPAIFNNFAARMDWASQGKGNRNPIVIVDGQKGLDIIYKEVEAGKTFCLDASPTSDPDNDPLNYCWWNLKEAGNYESEVIILNEKTSQPSIQIPSDASGKEIHIICEVTDEGTPALTAYRRIVLTVKD